MNATLAIAKRELNAYFDTLIGWLCLLGFSLISGLIFAWIVTAYTDPMAMMSGQAVDINKMLIPDYFGTISILILLLSPALSMRIFAEDIKQKSFELLLSSPISSTEIVVGKFLGACAYCAVLLLSTLPLIIVLVRYGEPDINVLAMNYLSTFLMASSCISLGMMFSAFTRSQLIALALSFISVLSLWFLFGLSQIAKGDAATVLAYISLLSHMEDMGKGVLHIKDLLYFTSFSAFFLFVSLQRLEAYRWQ